MIPFLSTLRPRCALCAAFATCLLTACSNDLPSEPTAAPAPVAAIAPAAAKAPIALDGSAIADVHGRLLPALQDAVLAAELRGQLAELSALLEKGDGAASLRSVSRAQKLLSTYAEHAAGAISAADLDAIRLALDATERSLSTGDTK
jgi:hypothetical protein